MGVKIPACCRVLPAFLLTVLAFGMPSAAASDAEKLQFIQQEFQANREHSLYWQRGWFGLFAGVATVQGVAWHYTDDDNDRYDRAVGFTTSALGAADMLLNPMRSHDYADQLAGGNVSLQQAEQWLAAAAAREQYERSLTNHLLAGLVNGLAGLAVAYDDKRPGDGWLTFASGMIATEVKIHTSPTRMSAAWQAYQRGELSPPATAKAELPRWQVAAAGPVLWLQYQF